MKRSVAATVAYTAYTAMWQLKVRAGTRTRTALRSVLSREVARRRRVPSALRGRRVSQPPEGHRRTRLSCARPASVYSSPTRLGIPSSSHNHAHSTLLELVLLLASAWARWLRVLQGRLCIRGQTAQARTQGALLCSSLSLSLASRGSGRNVTLQGVAPPHPPGPSLPPQPPLPLVAALHPTGAMINPPAQ